MTQKLSGMCLNKQPVFWERHGSSVWYIVCFVCLESYIFLFVGHAQIQEMALLLFIANL